MYDTYLAYGLSMTHQLQDSSHKQHENHNDGDIKHIPIIIIIESVMMLGMKYIQKKSIIEV